MKRIGGILSMAGWLATGAGCGDALSSLDAVQQSTQEIYSMTLSPDFGRQGASVVVKVIALDPALAEMLEQSIHYPAEITFGDGIFIEAFGTNADDQLEITVFISTVAETGERRPALRFAVGDRLVEARGSFWILPAQPG